jgi:hypothetical protein
VIGDKERDGGVNEPKCKRGYTAVVVAKECL